jgi:type I restriction enzyme M protein
VDSLASDPGERFSMVLTNPALRQEEQHLDRQRGGRPGEGGARLRAAGLLDDHQEQAAQLPPAHQDAAEGERPRGGGGAGQRALRGRRRRDRAAEPAEAVRRAHAAAPAHGHLLRPGREGQRAVLRRQAAQEAAWTKKLWVYDLRTNMHFTQKERPLKRADLDEFVACFNPENRHKRKPTWAEARARASAPRAAGARSTTTS